MCLHIIGRELGNYESNHRNKLEQIVFDLLAKAQDKEGKNGTRTKWLHRYSARVMYLTSRLWTFKGVVNKTPRAARVI